jgi:hypothetical protein
MKRAIAGRRWAFARVRRGRRTLPVRAALAVRARHRSPGAHAWLVLGAAHRVGAVLRRQHQPRPEGLWRGGDRPRRVEVAPGVYASYNSTRAQGFLDYSLIGRIWEDSDYNEVSHRLTTSGDYLAVPDLVPIRVQATYSDGVVDPTGASTTVAVGLFDPTNSNERLDRVHLAADLPRFSRLQLRRELHATAGCGTSTASPIRPVPSSRCTRTTPSTSRRWSVSRPSATATSRVGCSTSGSTRISPTTVDYRYERAGVELGRRLTRTLRAVGDYGLESDLDQSTTEGGLDSSFWHAGLEWVPDERTNVEARYGQRFFGDSWSATPRATPLRHDPAVLHRGSDRRDAARRHQFRSRRDSAATAGRRSCRGSPRPLTCARTRQATSSSPKARKTKIRLSAYDRRRDYIRDFPPDEHRQGATFAWCETSAHISTERSRRATTTSRPVGATARFPTRGAPGVHLPLLRLGHPRARHVAGVRQLRLLGRGRLPEAVRKRPTTTARGWPSGCAIRSSAHGAGA